MGKAHRVGAGSMLRLLHTTRSVESIDAATTAARTI